MWGQTEGVDLNFFMTSGWAWGVAFFAGVAAFFSTCVLPMLPTYVSYFTGLGTIGAAPAVAGTTRGLLAFPKSRFHHHKILINALWFVLGFLAVFMLLGLASGILGSWLTTHKVLMKKIGGGFLIIFGWHLLQIWKIPWLYKRWGFAGIVSAFRWPWLNTFLTGITFGFAWTPCIGPVLGAILLLATFAEGSVRGMLLMGTFALGLGTPFLVSALGIEKILPFLQHGGKYLVWVQRATGAILLITGIIWLLN